MNKYIIPIIILLLSANLNSQTNKSSYLNGNSTTGKHFLVSFPLNDCQNCPQQGLGFNITSEFDTKVEMSIDRLGISHTFNVKANEVKLISTEDGTVSFAWELLDAGQVSNLVVEFKAEYPINLVAFNSKQVSSESFLVLPVESWGTEYIHNSFYDFDEVREWAGGFCIIASEDNTEVVINIKDGANNTIGFGETKSGFKHGDVVEVTLNKNQVYLVEGTGTTRGIFDLSGSSISASNPIGVISYHNRTMIPANIVSSGRDHLLEMISPVSAWDNEYFSVQFDRGMDYGDYFRVIASEPNTQVVATWWSSKEDSLDKVIDSKSFTLSEKGDFWEYNNTGANAPHPHRSIRGVSSFKANKPIQVVQYSYSAYWDGASGNYDPFMINLLPESQYFNRINFLTLSNNSSNNEFKDHFVSLIAVGSAQDSVKNDSLLGSIYINGNKVLSEYPEFRNHNIPGTDKFWIFLSNLKTGKYEIDSDTKLGGYLYGFGGFDSYGHNLGGYQNLQTIDDNKAPTLTFDYDYDSKLLSISATDEESGIKGIRSINGGDDFKDTEYSMEEMVENYSDEYVFNPPDDGFFYFAAVDRAGNSSIDSIAFYSPLVVLDNSEKIIFNEILEDTVERTFYLTNEGKGISIIGDIYLSNNKYFSLNNADTFIGDTLKAGESIGLVIKHYTNDNQLAKSSELILENKSRGNNQFTFPIESERKLYTEISLLDVNILDFGVLEDSDSMQEGFRFRSTGTYRAKLEDINFSNGEYFEVLNFDQLSDDLYEPSNIFRVEFKFNRNGELNKVVNDTLNIVESNTAVEKTFSFPVRGEISFPNTVENLKEIGLEIKRDNNIVTIFNNSAEKILSITLFDIQANELFRNNDSSHFTFDMNDLSNGVYFLRIEMNNSFYHYKIIN